MSTIYYYAKKEAIPVYLKYGIRLSKNFDKEFNINGYQKPYLIGLLNPKDDMNKFASMDYFCIKLDVLDSHLLVIDASKTDDNQMMKEVTPIEKYVFGSFLKPRVLIDTSVISDKISLYNPVQDIPLFYDNSKDFFYQVQIEKRLNELPLEEIYQRLKE